jgi:hypothetical protein
MHSAGALYEVVAGLIPGQPEPRHTKRFGITREEYDEGRGLARLLEEWHKAVAYATFLQLLCAHGREVNWVRIDFVWP